MKLFRLNGAFIKLEQDVEKTSEGIMHRIEIYVSNAKKVFYTKSISERE